MINSAWFHIQSIIFSYLQSYYTCTIRITSEDAMFAAVMEFLDENKVFVTEGDAPTPTKSFGKDMWDFAVESDSDDDDDDIDHERPYIRNRKKVKYAPTPAYAHYFIYKPTGHTVTALRMESSNGQAVYWRRPRETLSLSIMGRNTAPLKSLLQEVCDRENRKDDGRTTVYKASQGQDGGGPEWTRCFSRAVRDINTVILGEEQKDALCADISEYLLPATSKWYANRGLPYRRGYLLYGPPGTGKTSLTVALAGQFGLMVYSLSLSVAWMNDDTLAHLFSRLPRKCIVLLEDIDACGVTRDTDSAVPVTADPKDTKPNPTAPTAIPRVSFSGLLNAIDGVASKEGRVLMMTTNHRERLDEALIRPGRIDMQIEFSHAGRGVIHGLFVALYTVDAVDRGILKFPEDFPHDDEMAKLADAFAAKVPVDIFSPAQVQGYLLRHKKDPRTAVAKVGDWVVEAMAEKAKKEEKERLEKIAKEKKEKEEKEAKEKEEKASKDAEDLARLLALATKSLVTNGVNGVSGVKSLMEVVETPIVPVVTNGAVVA
ncbi:P-loop containing nucleoside triphosphate hydrolase protein [Peziza echinospora]|nr:P-loop containing nucleoside triphosphate hydrolase protein [Peziza echinospora]